MDLSFAATNEQWVFSEHYVNVNVNVRHIYWAPLNPVTEALYPSRIWVKFISVAYVRRCGRAQLFSGYTH